MSVFTNKYHDVQEFGFGGRHTNTCFRCGGPCHYPFLHWDGKKPERSLFICSRCCHEIKSGLMADLVHLAAIVDLRRLGYVKETLTRESLSTIEARGERQREEDLRALMRVVK
jgi:hypothetical protein